MGTRIVATFGVWTGVEKPTAANTGATGTLTTLMGDQVITTPGTVLEDLDIHGKVSIRAADVILRNCNIRGNATASTNSGIVDCTHSACLRALIEDCTIYAENPSVWWTGILGHDYTARRVNVHHVVDFFGCYNTNNTAALLNVLIEQCYGHDMSCLSPDPNHTDNHTHNDGIQIQGGGGVTARYNNLVCTPGSGSTPGVTPTSSIMVTPNLSACPSLVFVDNWLDGGAAVINISDKGKGTATSGWIANNRFGRTSSGYMMLVDVTLTGFTGLPAATALDTNNGNVYDNDNTPVRVYRLDI